MSGWAIAAEAAQDLLNLGYNHWRDQITRNREDNAVQRRVQDLKNAGLNPILAAGMPAQSSAGTPANIDLSIAQNALIGKELEQKKIENATMAQEYIERGRNIAYYAKNGMPSDRPQSWAQDLAQAIELLKPMGQTTIGGTVDAVKAKANSAKDYLIENTPKAIKRALELPNEIDHKVKNWAIDKAKKIPFVGRFFK